MYTHRRAVFALLTIGLAMAQDQSGKKLLPGEFEIYNEIVKDINQKSFSKALAGIDAWRQKFPDSAYADDGAALEVQAFAETRQPAKALDTLSALMTRNLETVFPGPDGQATVIRLLYSATWAISQLADPTPDEVSTGQNAARQLMDYDRQLPGVSSAQWEQARADMKEKAGTALFYLAMLPGRRAMARQPPDCQTAESAYAAALGVYPGRSVLSYELGRALNCQVQAQPEKVFFAIYEFERAAVIDSRLGDPSADPSRVRTYADNAYIRIHGSAEGLEQLKELVKQSPLPPAGFRFQTADEIAAQKRVALEQSNPQLAMWMKIKAELTDAGGASFFDEQMKDSLVPLLRGTLVNAKPGCRPRELFVAVPLPGSSPSLVTEIRLTLDKPFPGKPVLGTEFQWEGVATAFSPQPFLLTLETEAKRILGLKLDRCSVPIPKKREPAKKGHAFSQAR